VGDAQPTFFVSHNGGSRVDGAAFHFCGGKRPRVLQAMPEE
jgi:hypothetical protein